MTRVNPQLIDSIFSRIHISKAALDNLNETYEVEPRHPPECQGDRDPFLVDNNIETFLIVRKIKQTSNAKTSAPTTPTTNQVRGQLLMTSS